MGYILVSGMSISNIKKFRFQISLNPSDWIHDFIFATFSGSVMDKKKSVLNLDLLYPTLLSSLNIPNNFHPHLLAEKPKLMYIDHCMTSNISPISIKNMWQTLVWGTILDPIVNKFKLKIPQISGTTSAEHAEVYHSHLYTDYLIFLANQKTAGCASLKN